MNETIESIDRNHLWLFERVAALGGFSAAARDLGVPKSNVSRAVAQLEHALQTRLFQRTTRSVTLTGAGEALYERCATLLKGLDDTLEYVGSLAGETADILERIVEPLQQRGATLVQRLAGPGECHAARGALEQPGLQCVLELRHRSTDIGLRHTKIASRGGKTAERRYTLEKPQVIPIDRFDCFVHETEFPIKGPL